jgi:hypothetical protein
MTTPTRQDKRERNQDEEEEKEEKRLIGQKEEEAGKTEKRSQENGNRQTTPVTHGCFCWSQQSLGRAAVSANRRREI